MGMAEAAFLAVRPPAISINIDDPTPMQDTAVIERQPRAQWTATGDCHRQAISPHQQRRALERHPPPATGFTNHRPAIFRQ
jgi:hypothetical protein